MMQEPRYPEHIKLQAVKEQSQTIGEFLEWLDSNGYYLGQYKGPGVTHGPANLVPSTKYSWLLAQHFGIDLQKIEQEKQEMLENIRRGNEQEREWND